MIGTVWGDYTVVRVLDDNLVVADSPEGEKLLFGAGIGVDQNGANPFEGDSPVVLVDALNPWKTRLEAAEPAEGTAGAVETALNAVEEELEEPLEPETKESLADHLGYMIKRIRENTRLHNPLLTQTRILYRREYQAARRGMERLGDLLHLDVPENETGFVAMHIRADRCHDHIGNTIRFAQLGYQVTCYLEQELDRSIDKEGLDYVRFLLHLNQAVQRLLDKNYILNPLLRQIRQEYTRSYRIAQCVCSILAKELEVEATEDETAYIAIYIERLRQL